MSEKKYRAGFLAGAVFLTAMTSAFITGKAAAAEAQAAEMQEAEAQAA